MTGIDNRSDMLLKPDDMRIRIYTKRELALLYFPQSTPHTAVNRLMRWVNGCAPLREALQTTGYKDKNRIFTPMQVALIVRHIGEPDFDAP